MNLVEVVVLNVTWLIVTLSIGWQWWKAEQKVDLLEKKLEGRTSR